MTMQLLFIIAGCVLQYIIGFSPWPVSSPAMLCRNRNIRCNVIANRLPQSLSFPKMLKGDVAISSFRNRSTIRNVISRNEAILTLEIATKTLLMFFLNKKHLHPGFSRNDDAAFCSLLRGVSFSTSLDFSPWSLSSLAMLCRNKKHQV
jgi:hypothetical protein